MKNYHPYEPPFKHGFAHVGAQEVMDLINGRAFKLEQELEDMRNGKTPIDNRTELTLTIVINELSRIMGQAETMERVTDKAKKAAFDLEMLTGIAPGRAAIAEEYDVDDLGIIRSPGKFEGEPAHAVYFWEVLLNGDGTPTYDQDGNEWTVLLINDEERAEFPELGNAKEIALTVNNEGFIFTVEDTDPAYKYLDEENAPEYDDEPPAIDAMHENGRL